jgi:hypothetical protein
LRTPQRTSLKNTLEDTPGGNLGGHPWRSPVEDTLVDTCGRLLGGHTIKGHEIFDPRFFSLKHPFWPLKGLKPFVYKFAFAKKLFDFLKRHPVSLTPDA